MQYEIFSIIERGAHPITYERMGSE